MIFYKKDLIKKIDLINKIWGILHKLKIISLTPNIKIKGFQAQMHILIWKDLVSKR